MSNADDYLWDGSGDADPEVARLEGLLRPLAHDRPLDEVRVRRGRRRRATWIGAAMTGVAAAAVLVIVLRDRGHAGPTCEPGELEVVGADGTPSCSAPPLMATRCEGGEGFAFRGQGGAVSCEGASVASGVLPVGGVLDTGARGAQLRIADIGSAELAPQTRVRLARTERGARHELHLERGTLHARVLAPPRIFAVTTPSTSVVDLGCEYTIDIDEHGAGSIVVQSGQVELAGDGDAIVVAPAGTETRLLAGKRPSLPIVASASAPLREAVAAYERTGAIEGVLSAATERDAVTIVALAVLARDRRPAVLGRLAALVPPPAGITIDGAAARPADLARWQADVISRHFAAHGAETTKQDY